MPNHPREIVPINHVEAVPRRIRAYLGQQKVLDTVHALYVWESTHYPQYYIPLDDVRAEFLVRSGQVHPSRRGPVETCGLKVADVERAGAARLHTDATVEGLANTVRFEWGALDSWFEEDEQVFVHPRSPYTRVDALRSTRAVRVELDGVVLAESNSPVLVFETGLITRYYLNRTDVDFSHLEWSPTQTACPYKGTTSGYWSARIGDELHADLAWAYDFPTRQLLPIAGLVAFYNEKVDTFVDGQLVDRPPNAFS